MSRRQIRLDDAALRDALLEEPRRGLAHEVAAGIEASIGATRPDRRLLRLGGHRLLWTDVRGWARALRFVAVAAVILAAVVALLAVGAVLPGPVPGNGLIVLGSDRVGLFVADLQRRETHQLVAPWQANPSGRTNRSDLLALSPRGDRLAYIVSGIDTWSIRILELPSGRPVAEVGDDGRRGLPEWAIQWSHDGSRLLLEATVNGLPRIVAADLITGTLVDVGAADALSRDVAASPVDARAAFVQSSSAFRDDYGLVIWDAASGETSELGAATAAGFGTAAPAWAPDGRTLAVTVTRADGASAVARIGADGSGFAVLSPWTERWPFARWSPDGSSLLVVIVPQGGREADIYTNGEQPAELYLVAPDGGDWRALVAGACSSVAWAPDGDSILYERGTCGGAADVAEVRVIGVDGSGDRAIWSGDARATGRLSLGWQPIP